MVSRPIPGRNLGPTFFPGRKVISLLLLLVATAFSLRAQNDVVERWSQASSYGAVPGAAVAVDASGNAYGTLDLGGGLYLEKRDADGNLAWTAEYVDPDTFLRASDVLVHDGRVYVGGFSYIPSGGGGNGIGPVLAAFDTAGNFLWYDRVGATQLSVVGGLLPINTRIAVDPGGRIAVMSRAWTTNPSGGTDLNYLALRYRPDGTLDWVRTISHAGVDYPQALAVNAQGRMAISGSSGSNRFTVVLDSAGNELWSHTQVATNGGGLVLLDDGQVYVHSGVFNVASSTDLQLTHYAADGTVLANVTHDLGGSETGRMLRRMPNGNLVGGAFAVQAAPLFPYVDWLVVGYDPAGNLLWSDRYDGLQNNDEFINDLAVNERSETVVIGTGGPAVPFLFTTVPQAVHRVYAPDGELLAFGLFDSLDRSPVDLALVGNDEWRTIGTGSAMIRAVRRYCPPPSVLQTGVSGSAVSFDWNDVPEALGYLFQGEILATGATKNKKRATSAWNVPSLSAGNYAWRVKTACPLDTSAFSADALFSIPMLRAPQADTEATLWAAPNPAVDQTVLSWTGAANTLDLTDLGGRLLRSVPLSADVRQQVLSVAGLPAGLYLVHLSRADGTRSTGRLMVR